MKPPEGRTEAPNSKWMMESIVYLPIHSGMADNEIRQTVERTIECYQKLSKYLTSNDAP